MHYKIDKELIGGMVIRIKDRILDNSIKTKLDTMARELRQVQL
jgi:F-type H+-transporting ATPase subunit delta